MRLVENGTGVLVAEGPHEATAAELWQGRVLAFHIGYKAPAVDIGNMVAELARKHGYSLIFRLKPEVGWWVL